MCKVATPYAVTYTYMVQLIDTYKKLFCIVITLKKQLIFLLLL